MLSLWLLWKIKKTKEPPSQLLIMSVLKALQSLYFVVLSSDSKKNLFCIVLSCPLSHLVLDSASATILAGWRSSAVLSNIILYIHSRYYLQPNHSFQFLIRPWIVFTVCGHDISIICESPVLGVSSKSYTLIHHRFLNMFKYAEHGKIIMPSFHVMLRFWLEIHVLRFIFLATIL